MADISQTTFSSAFSWMIMYEFSVRSHRPLSEQMMDSRPQWVNVLLLVSRLHSARINHNADFCVFDLTRTLYSNMKQKGLTFHRMMIFLFMYNRDNAPHRWTAVYVSNFEFLVKLMECCICFCLLHNTKQLLGNPRHRNGYVIVTWCHNVATSFGKQQTKMPRMWWTWQPLLIFHLEHLHTNAETKWLPFSIRHFQIDMKIEWKYMNFD